ncbi:uncharacterized protein K441DRAFT_83148 [Cenococcum geophilum 1.58]|uniref:uncharacterized protein n=1 Tax=Cenococcum geophilum 1.58 TaxID=794803 RepID=UPI00358E8DDD|nr:hypothetical protein K441DRAFT_83148 [Cenococcum geophilum 1.58]
MPPLLSQSGICASLHPIHSSKHSLAHQTAHPRTSRVHLDSSILCKGSLPREAAFHTHFSSTLRCCRHPLTRTAKLMSFVKNFDR